MHKTGWDNNGYIFQHMGRQREEGQCHFDKNDKCSQQGIMGGGHFYWSSYIPKDILAYETKFTYHYLHAKICRKKNNQWYAHRHTHMDLAEVKLKTCLKYSALKWLNYYFRVRLSDKKQKFRCLPSEWTKSNTKGTLAPSRNLQTDPLSWTLPYLIPLKKQIKRTRNWKPDRDTCLLKLNGYQLLMTRTV